MLILQTTTVKFPTFRQTVSTEMSGGRNRNYKGSGVGNMTRLLQGLLKHRGCGKMGFERLITLVKENEISSKSEDKRKSAEAFQRDK